ncbi:hypothetical protein THAR02_07162 [Trichoderma harzianum]|uniref:Uncharacterized protein n=1 Tax=Trichoderma harzianum TaxID=5544 RepID=A0A0F9X6C6_TRIHA|nr:hypothetical protein THAR02_07162 [Trichoderma harzianum]
MMAESVAGREEKRAAERLDFTNASKDARKGEGAASQQREGNRRTVDAAATASARQVKEKRKEGKGTHEKKEKSHQATGRGKTERRKRGGGGGEGLETGAKILWAATHQPLVARMRMLASHRACICTWIPGPGWRSAGGTGTRPAHSHIGTDERASPLPGPSAPSLRATQTEPASRHEDGQEALWTVRTGGGASHLRLRVVVFWAVCACAGAGIILASSNQGPQTAFHLRSAG